MRLIVKKLLCGALVAACMMIASPPPTSAKESVSVGDSCATKGKTLESGALLLECGPKLRWRSAIEGKPCVKDAAMVGDLSCMRRQSQRQWMKRYVYQDQACDPEDPRLAAAKISLPPTAYQEGQIAAACVALAWIAETPTTTPTIEIIAPSQTSNLTLASIALSAEWQLKWMWPLRTDPRVTTPTMFLFDDITFLCERGEEVFRSDYLWLNRRVLGSPGYIAEHPKSQYSCLDQSKTWTCQDTPDVANGVPTSLWKATGRSGLIQAVCPEDLQSPIELNPIKFYLGLTGCIGKDPNLCEHWAGAAAYIYALYGQEMGEAKRDGTGANLDLCSATSWMTWCPQSDRLFRSYIPSSRWLTIPTTSCWPGSPPYGDDGTCNKIRAFSSPLRGYAFEWLTAHFGLEAAFGIISATAPAKRDKSLYLRILEAYTGMKPAAMFASIDRYVQGRIASRIR
jgi:hypothetical protein